MKSKYYFLLVIFFIALGIFISLSENKVTGSFVEALELDENLLEANQEINELENSGFKQKKDKFEFEVFNEVISTKFDLKETSPTTEISLGRDILIITMDKKNMEKTTYSNENSDVVVFENDEDSISYGFVEKEDNVLMKEWIFREKKPEGVLEYKWELSLKGPDELIIEPDLEEGLNIFKRINVSFSGNNEDLDRASRAVKTIWEINLFDQKKQIAYLERPFYTNSLGEKIDLDWQVQENTISFQIDEINYPIAIDPTFTWGQWLGGDRQDTVRAVAINVNEIYVGGETGRNSSWESIPWSGVADLQTHGFVVEINDTGSPVINWGQWLGGSNVDRVYALAVNGDEIYAGGSAGSNVSWTPISWSGNYSGSNEGFVVEIQDGASPTINWGYWLGGSSADDVFALAVNGDEIYAGGGSSSNTSWENISTSWNGTYSGGAEGFVVEIQDGASPTFNWGQWLGGTLNDYVRALAVNEDEIYAAGESNNNISWENFPNSWNGTCSGLTEGFVVEIQDGASPTFNWGQWIGSIHNDYTYAVAVNRDEIYIGGTLSNNVSLEPISWSGTYTSAGSWEGYVIEIQDGTSPTINWGQWLGGTGAEYVRALVVNRDEVYAAGDSTSNDSLWDEPFSWNGTYSGGAEGFVIELQDAVSPTINWGHWIGGTGNDYIHEIDLTVDEIYIGGEAGRNTSMENISTLWSGEKTGSAGFTEGFAVALLDDVLDCSPRLDEDWIITDEQICDGVEETTGTGKILININGNLTLINTANVTSAGFEINRTGDSAFIHQKSMLIIT